jgi:hypothetical protein
MGVPMGVPGDRPGRGGAGRADAVAGEVGGKDPDT